MRVKVMPEGPARIINRNAVAHALTARDHRFTTGPIGYDKSRTLRVPMKASNYRFDYSVHPIMTGTITVR